MDELRFSIKRKNIQVILEDENDEEQEYYLLDLTGKERDQWLAFLGKRLTRNTDGTPTGLKTFDGLACQLLVLSLYKSDKITHVEKKFIDELPCEVQESLFDASQELSGLTSKSVEEAGND